MRRIADAGHEIACHGDRHRRVFEMSRANSARTSGESRDSLQEIVGKPVTSFRAPEWSMRSARNPAFAVLAEEGFTLDSSLTTAPPVGEPSNPERPATIETASGPILEVPPLMGTFFGFRAMWGGGVCARLTRESRVSAAIERALADGVPPVLYAHPWEFDDAHPPMPGLSPVERLVHFAGRTADRGAVGAVPEALDIRSDLVGEDRREEEESSANGREEKISSNGKRGGVAA